eukprot:gnl/MRDRNA2_/MRDRNA2_99489_c0_seq1.p1 gnl/MRDRNA2_/MRDRNA2_99489_c0~~gnl/MRDRNA2_/MRDRNA2_99489_c0_seq1.p1  ORF type:complete len:160 (-),score=30.57 gnl/MRDRNA2_/MRDRNA2_99489_c0_seq1:10-489(-)
MACFCPMVEACPDGTPCHPDMRGVWAIDADVEGGYLKGGHSWQGTLYVLSGTEEHFEGDVTGVLKKFRAANGVWSATVVFDAPALWGGGGALGAMQKAKKYAQEYGVMETWGRSEAADTFTLTGTYDQYEAECHIAPGRRNSNPSSGIWKLHKIGEAHH